MHHTPRPLDLLFSSGCATYCQEQSHFVAKSVIQTIFFFYLLFDLIDNCISEPLNQTTFCHILSPTISACHNFLPIGI